MRGQPIEGILVRALQTSRLDVDPAEALVRLRAHALARGITAAEVATQIVVRRMSLDSRDWQDPPNPDRAWR